MTSERARAAKLKMKQVMRMPHVWLPAGVRSMRIMNLLMEKWEKNSRIQCDVSSSLIQLEEFFFHFFALNRGWIWNSVLVKSSRTIVDVDNVTQWQRNKLKRKRFAFEFQFSHFHNSLFNVFNFCESERARHSFAFAVCCSASSP